MRVGAAYTQGKQTNVRVGNPLSRRISDWVGVFAQEKEPMATDSPFQQLDVALRASLLPTDLSDPLGSIEATLNSQLMR